MSKRWQLAFLGIVVLVSLRYWVAAMRWHPDDPFSVIALCKSGDIEYYPMVAALAQRNLGEAVVFEHLSNGYSSFPVMSIAPHALCVGLFGPYGFLIADIVVFLGYYGCLLALFQAARVRSPWRECLSLILVCGGNDGQYLLAKWAPSRLWQFFTDWDLTFWVWGERIPRPFVSELFLVLSLAAVLWVLRGVRGRPRPWSWIGLGFFLSMLLQGDLHAAIDVALLMAPVGLYLLWRTHRRASVAGGIALAALAFAAGCTLFIVQRLHEHPDLPVRFGLYPAARFDARFSDVHPLRRLLPVTALLGVTGLSIVALGRPRDRAIQLPALVFLWLADVIACYGLPLSIAILGKTIQPYHFTDRFMHIRAYTILISVCWLVTAWVPRLRFWKTTGLEVVSGPDRFAKAVMGLTLVWGLVWFALAFVMPSTPVDRWVLGDKFRVVQRDESQHMRASTFSHWQKLPDYRRDFAALAAELSTSRYDPCKVIGTFDLQVFSWWLTFRQGYAFLPEPFLSTLPDAEVERRLCLLCKLLGQDAATYREFINRRYVTAFWLSCDKYQASQAYRFAALEDYPDDVKRGMESTTVYSCWNLAIPMSEQERLVRAFEHTELDATAMPRLDVIVLIKALEPGPPAKGFQPTYENPTFKVWVRQG